MSSALVPCGHCHALNRIPNDKLKENPSCGKCKQSVLGGRVIALNQAGFKRFVEKSELPIVVDFWAPWCGPCKMMAPNFEKVAKAMEGEAVFVKINTEQEQALAGQYNIRSIPTLAVFKKGVESTRQAGAMDASSLQAWVKRSL